MAGHRRATGAGKRSETRPAEHERRVARAASGERQLGAAFDYWRSAAYRHPDRQALLHSMATTLVTAARRLTEEAAA